MTLDSEISPSPAQNSGPPSANKNLDPPIFHDFDSALNFIGGFGRYQMFLAAFAQWGCLLMAGNVYMMSFGSLVPTWRCESVNWTTAAPTIDHCHFIDNCTDSNGTDRLLTTSQFYSVVEEWKLTCDKDFIPGLMISIQMLGHSIGGPVAGHVADHVGRKWVTVVGLVGALASGALCSIATSWQLLTALMFLLGLFLTIYYSSFFVLTMEFTGKRYRIITNCCYTWSVAFQVSALIAYLCRDWRIYAATINAICAPLGILIFFTDESPRWLIQKKKFHRAASILNKMARWNKRSDTRSDMRQISAQSLETIQFDQQSSSGSSSYSFISLFSTKRLAVYMIVCLLSYFISASVSGVILFNVGQLIGSPFLNVALYGIIRIWTPPFMVLMEMKSGFFGRRPMFLYSLAFVIACFAGITAIYATGTSDSAWLTVATSFALAGSCINASIFDSSTTLYATELFPTVIRAIAFGTLSLASYVGSIVAPQLLYLQKYWKELPYTVLASIGILAWIIGFFVLPETGGKPLPDKLDVGNNTGSLVESDADDSKTADTGPEK